MTLKRCDNGHYFEAEKYRSCPNCGVKNFRIDTTRTTQENDTPTAQAGYPSHSDDQATRRSNDPRGARDPGATQAIWNRTLGIDPVVGWLVCIAGPDKGRDYRIHSERNNIGRDPSMQICISGDETISREKHAVISYNPRKNSFLLLPGEGRGLVYLNDDEVATPTPLNDYDIIELGQTRLTFVRFCGERFQWETD